MITQDQWMGWVRMGVAFGAGMAVDHGWLPPAEVAAVSTFVLSIAGPVFLFASFLWSLKANSPSSIRQSASAVPNTVVVQLKPTGNNGADVEQTVKASDQIATLNQVQQVISTPDVEAATASDKVVSGATAAATS